MVVIQNMRGGNVVTMVTMEVADHWWGGCDVSDLVVQLPWCKDRGEPREKWRVNVYIRLEFATPFGPSDSLAYVSKDKIRKWVEGGRWSNRECDGSIEVDGRSEPAMSV